MQTDPASSLSAHRTMSGAESRRTLVASDWHLGSFTPPPAAELARRFLERACTAGDRVVLNGDIFEGLFQPVACAEAAHPELRDAIARMTSAGQLVRTAGNHDPDAGHQMLVLNQQGLGHVLITHGHIVDPLHHSRIGTFGDAISRRLGRLGVIRGAARVAEHAANRFAGIAIERWFRARCRSVVERERCNLGVFGHIHRRYLAPGDPYANAGRLTSQRLDYLILADGTVQLASLTLAEQRPKSRIAFPDRGT